MSVKKINQLIWEAVDKADKKRLKKQTFSFEDVVVKKNISYFKHGKSSLLDLYLPKNHTHKLPIIINVPGGGYTGGNKENNRLQSEMFARQGFCVLTINYRKINEKSFPAQVRDLFKVFSFIEQKLSNKKFDIDNIFLMGDSAGAHIAALASTMANNHLMQYDFGVFSNLKIKGCAFFSSSFQVLNFPIIKNSYKKAIYGNNIVYDKITNVKQVLNKDFPPNVVISPINDFLIFQSLAFNKKCKELGIENKFILLKQGKGLGHISMIKHANHSSYKNMYEQVFDFFKSKVALKINQIKDDKKEVTQKPKEVTQKIKNFSNEISF